MTNLDNMIVVLNDGETYTSLRGCMVFEVPENVDDDDIEFWVFENQKEGTPIEALLSK
jgi:hypothetical protein